MSDRYVHYGCGMSAPEGWDNFDASPTLRFERIPLLGRLYTKNAGRFPATVRYGDIVKGLPLPEGSCRAIYCSHVLEHLARDEASVALRNTLHLLAPGGVFRLVLPDLESHARAYVNDPSPNAAAEFLDATALGCRNRPRGARAFLASLLGNSRHLWMWDERSLTQALTEAGFVDVRRAAFGDGEDPRFREVECEERFANALAMQCRHP